MEAMLSRVLRAVAFLSLIVLASVHPAEAQQTGKRWRDAPELRCDCELDRNKPTQYGSAEPEVAGAEITSFAPIDYTTGDMFANGKLVLRSDGSIVREFEKVPVAWNRTEKAFEFDLEKYLVRVSGLPVRPKVAVLTRIEQPADAAPRKKEPLPAKSTAPTKKPSPKPAA